MREILFRGKRSDTYIFGEKEKEIVKKAIKHYGGKAQIIKTIEEKECPNVAGVTCWEQYLKHLKEREK